MGEQLLVGGPMPSWERRVLEEDGGFRVLAEAHGRGLVRGFAGRCWAVVGRFATAMGRPVLRLVRDEAPHD